MQSEHVSDPAKPGLRRAKRGGTTLFQKGGPNRLMTVIMGIKSDCGYSNGQMR